MAVFAGDEVILDVQVVTPESEDTSATLVGENAG